MTSAQAVDRTRSLAEADAYPSLRSASSIVSGALVVDDNLSRTSLLLSSPTPTDFILREVKYEKVICPRAVEMKKWLETRSSKAKGWMFDKWKAFLAEAQSWIDAYARRVFLILVGSIFIALILWLVPKWQV